jgi:hypothetical protein
MQSPVSGVLEGLAALAVSWRRLSRKAAFGLTAKSCNPPIWCLESSRGPEFDYSR